MKTILEKAHEFYYSETKGPWDIRSFSAVVILTAAVFAALC